MTERGTETGLAGAELLRLISGQVCVHACMAGVRMTAPLLALRDGYSAAAIGLLLALFSLSQVFLALPAGRFADRYGLKRPVGCSIVAAVLGAGMAVAWPIFPVVCVTAMLVGGAAGATVIAMQRHVGRAASGTGELRRVFSWLAIGPAVSNVIGPFLAGLMIDHFGYRAAFLALALLPLVGWVLMRTARELPPLERSLHAARARTWDLLREPVFRRLMTVNWLQSACWDVHAFIVPVLGHDRGLSASVIGSILAGFAVATTAIRLLMPLVSARVREWAMIAFSMAASAAIFVVYPLVHSAIAMGLCSMALGLVLGMVQPNVMSLLHQVTPEHRHGEALGLRLMIVNASSVAMPLLFGVTGAFVGVTGVFWTVAAAVGAGTRVAWKLKDDRTT